MSDIPPPLQPGQPRPRRDDDDELLLPWKLADAPRLQLEFLSRSTALNKSHREAVRDWLSGYNAYVARYLTERYGPDAVQAADAISRGTASRMNENQQAAQEKAERALFEKLEKDFKDE